MDSPEERPVHSPPKGPPKSRQESLCHEERQLFCKNRGKLAAIMWHPSDLVMVYSEALTYVAQFVQRDEVNVRLHAWVCGLLPIGRLALVNVKRLKCTLSFFGTYLVKDSDLADDC
jgi:hypothetical protein